MAYTVAVREAGKSGPWLYIDEHLRCVDTATHCKPLSRQDAQLAKRLLVDGAAEEGRRITARIVRLCA